jgi:hypothetical protein
MTRPLTQCAGLPAAIVALATTSVAAPSLLPPHEDVATRLLDRRIAPGVANLPPTVKREREAFTELLSGSYDWAVMPFRVQDAGVDRAQRSMMARILARALADRGLSVADPGLLERAAGEDRRVAPAQNSAELFEHLGARNVVAGYVGHDERGRLRITLSVERAPSQGVGGGPFVTWSDLPFSVEIPPMEAFRARLPEILDALHVGGTPRANQTARAEAFEFPESPSGLVATPGANALDDAIRLLILATLAPHNSRAAERLFERSLLSLPSHGESTGVAFVRASSLFHLNLRPAALMALQDSHSPGIDGLREILNGNVPGTRELVQKTTGYQRFVLEFELQDLGLQYHSDVHNPLPAILATLASRSAGWATLIDQRWYAADAWHARSNGPLKDFLDHAYPVPGLSLRDVIDGLAATPGQEPTWTDVEVSVRNHIRRLMADQRLRWCCVGGFTRPYDWDLLAVIEAWSDENLRYAVVKRGRLQGLPAEALQMAAELEPYLGGDPGFDELRAELNQALAAGAGATGPKLAAYRQAARELATAALVRSGGQTVPAFESLTVLGVDDTALAAAQAFGKDWPAEPWWPIGAAGTKTEEQLAFIRPRLANTQTDATLALTMLTIGGSDVVNEVAGLVRGRFRGSPALPPLEDKLRPPDVSRATAPEARARRMIKDSPRSWDGYEALWTYFARRGEFTKAVETIESFPDFHAAHPSSTVGLSNNASSAGHWFYWHALIPEARRVYHLATQWHTGSEAEMVADVRLHLFDQDYAGALEAARERAERYGGGAAYRDYLSLLHALGRSKEAWSSFNALLDRPLGWLPWESASLGHRIEAATPAQLKAWLNSPQVRRAVAGTDPLAAEHLVEWALTDRDSFPDLVSQVRALAGEPRGVIENTGGRIASYPLDPNGNRMLVARSAFREDTRPKLAAGTPVDSQLALYAAAAAAWADRDYPAAVAAFDAVAARFPFERAVQGDATQILGYFAYSAAKTGDTLGLEAFVSAFPEDQQDFDYFLAIAAFRALRHADVDGSLKALKQAYLGIGNFSRIPSAGYQYADVTERLYRDTGDARFRDIVIDWVRRYRQAQPFAAWAYAMDAALTADPTARRQPLVIALYLDPLSPHLKGIQPAEITAARVELAEGNPFLRVPRAPQNSVTTGQVP